MTNTILRLPAVLRERGRSRSAHYFDIQQGLFTHPVQIGLRAVGWPTTEVATINAAFTPSAEAVERAQTIVDAFAANPDAGVLQVDGRMVDAPHLKQARRVLARR